ncbi:dUTP diphosphatase [soil metagenome]
MPVIKFKLLNKDAKLPVYLHEDDAAFDIYAVESVLIKKKKYKSVSTGVASEIPKGYFVSIRDRSGLAFKNGIHLLGGVIDAGYRGEWFVAVANLGDEDYKIEKGDRIAQGILHKIPKAKIKEVKNLSDTDRGEKGIGSTGKK